MMRPAGTFRKRRGVGLLLILAAGCHAKGPTEGKTVAELEAMLRGGDRTAQAQGALGLGKLGPAAAPAVPALAEALKDSDALVRQNAALALGSVGPDARAGSDWLTNARAAMKCGVVNPITRRKPRAASAPCNKPTSLRVTRRSRPWSVT